jgi:anti-repressor protein
MEELIPYAQRAIGSEVVPTVDGRDLYDFLSISKDYTSWVRAQIKRAHLVENRDYIVFTQKGENSLVGRPGMEYYFTFDAAKHIGMLSSTAKGHEVREYFLSCERQIQAQAAAASSVRIPQVKHADMRAIIDMAIAIDENRQIAEDARAAAEDARAKALLALQGQQWISIRQYVTIYNLTRQLPLALQRDYGRWLTGLCRERGIPVYKLQSLEYAEEHTYLASLIQETLGGWLTRRSGQGTLTVVQ